MSSLLVVENISDWSNSKRGAYTIYAYGCSLGDLYSFLELCGYKDFYLHYTHYGIDYRCVAVTRFDNSLVKNINIKKGEHLVSTGYSAQAGYQGYFVLNSISLFTKYTTWREKRELFHDS